MPQRGVYALYKPNEWDRRGTWIRRPRAHTWDLVSIGRSMQARGDDVIAWNLMGRSLQPLL